MNLPITPWSAQPGNLWPYLKQLATAIAAGWSVEHDADGHHAFPSGTWTPIVGGDTSTSGQVYKFQVARWVKIGMVVHCWCNVALSTKGTLTGSVRIHGLPFRVRPGHPNVAAAVSIGYWITATAFVWVGGYVAGGFSNVRLIGLTAAGSATAELVPADLANTSQFVMTATYETDQ